MKKWLWDLSFRIGFEKIDMQHKELFSIANDLIAASDSKDDLLAIKNTLKRLKNYIETHFKDEEQIMAKFKFPLVDEHKKIHSEITASITNSLKSSTDINTIKMNLENLLGQWIRNHILIEDKKFSEWIKVNNLL